MLWCLALRACGKEVMACPQLQVLHDRSLAPYSSSNSSSATPAKGSCTSSLFRIQVQDVKGHARYMAVQRLMNLGSSGLAGLDCCLQIGKEQGQEPDAAMLEMVKDKLLEEL